MSISSFLLDDKSESRTLHTDVERTCRGRGCIGSGPGWGVTSYWAPPGSGIIQVTPSEKEAIERVSVQHCVPAMLITFIYMCIL